MFTLLKSQIQPMGALKTMQALLSFVVRLQAGLPGILTLKDNNGTQHFCNALKRVFTEATHWADLVIELQCLPVCLFVSVVAKHHLP